MQTHESIETDTPESQIACRAEAPERRRLNRKSPSPFDLLLPYQLHWVKDDSRFKGRDFTNIQRQLKLRVVSTFNGRNNKFYSLWENRSHSGTGILPVRCSGTDSHATE